MNAFPVGALAPKRLPNRAVEGNGPYLHTTVRACQPC
jgi:hypothetical protein